MKIVKQKKFTLIELLVVVAIIGILVSYVAKLHGTPSLVGVRYDTHHLVRCGDAFLSL